MPLIWLLPLGFDPGLSYQTESDSGKNVIPSLLSELLCSVHRFYKHPVLFSEAAASFYITYWRGGTLTKTIELRGETPITSFLICHTSNSSSKGTSEENERKAAFPTLFLAGEYIFVFHRGDIAEKVEMSLYKM